MIEERSEAGVPTVELDLECRGTGHRTLEDLERVRRTNATRDRVSHQRDHSLPRREHARSRSWVFRTNGDDTNAQGLSGTVQSRGVRVNASVLVQNGVFVRVVVCSGLHQRVDDRCDRRRAITRHENRVTIPADDSGPYEEPSSRPQGHEQFQVLSKSVERLLEIHRAREPRRSRIEQVVPPNPGVVRIHVDDERAQIVHDERFGADR